MPDKPQLNALLQALSALADQELDDLNRAVSEEGKRRNRPWAKPGGAVERGRTRRGPPFSRR